MAPSNNPPDRVPRHFPLSTKGARNRNLAILRLMQRGLVYPAPHARFALFWLPAPDAISRSQFADILRSLTTHLIATFPNTVSAVLGVSFRVFRQWCAHDGSTPPTNMQYKFPIDQNGTTSQVFPRSNGVFNDAAADLFAHIKADTPEQLAAIYDFLLTLLTPYITPRRAFQDCNSRTVRGDDAGRVLGCRFAENLNNPADPITIATHTLIGYDDILHAGGSFVLAQRFHINWSQLHNLPEEAIEDIIGRTTHDILLPDTTTRSHIRCGRFRDLRGNSQFVMRLGLPFGTAAPVAKHNLRKGSFLGDEEGIFFAGYSRSVQTLESVMDQQIGDTPGFMKDRLFDHIRSDLGGFFYIPSLLDLHSDGVEWDEEADDDWCKFPGIDWSRLSRHFTEKSANGLMYYNHKNYLYEMATMPRKKARTWRPPSHRILTLLLDAFTVWQDTWYFTKNQPDMGHLRDYLAADPDFGPAVADNVMGQSVMVRKGWATRMTCRLYASHDYGFRGTRLSGEGEEITGADTFRVHPMEIIAGAMTDLTLGQGRCVIKYLREDEHIPAYFANLSEASGVGHVVPDFQKLVDMGLGGLLADVQARVDAADDATKRDFFTACATSLMGVQDFLARYADLAAADAAGMTAGQKREQENLNALSARLRSLVTDRPGTMLEAAQLIFTFFTCLQYNGEPVAVGRLDQYLGAFYEADLRAGRLDDDTAQEIIDAFWIKLDEKVLQNRLNMQDHQPPGNLAMGGVAGPYPQGASLNQWVQQVTVGGLAATDDDVPELAHNAVTKLCLRAAARLPLNAPCLSLRVCTDTPEDLLAEAATAILSGGAHPILLNDDKIVPGLVACGRGVGDGGDNQNKYTPVSEHTDGRFNSSVSLKSARNYACDGCYEPMFSGQNWFSLGGFSTLDPLEAALNRGRTYASAGPAFLRGQNVSFRSPRAEDISSFAELLELYFRHFYLMWARAFNGSLSTFDALVNFCPAPLLSVLTDDCLAKGLDIYQGGARYNVYGPCWTALSSTINSLYNINKMVFSPDTAVTSLPELVQCLICDWGEKMVEPFFSSTVGPTRLSAKAERFRRLRKEALSYERYGRAAPPSLGASYDPADPATFSVDQLGDYILRRICELTTKVFTDPFESTAGAMAGLAERYGTRELPFGLQILPGVGTFENYVAFGQNSGASADGRHNGEWIASDMSPSPGSMDGASAAPSAPFGDAMAGMSGPGADAMWEGAPVEYNIAEDFPKAKLVQVLRQFATGRGTNILTVTCANPENLESAQERLEKFDLLRVRMGGWSEFFTAIFPDSQDHHCRRPMSTPE